MTSRGKKKDCFMQEKGLFYVYVIGSECVSIRPFDSWESGPAMYLFHVSPLSGSPLATSELWSGTNKNRDVSTGPLARPFARSLALLTRSLAPDCSLRSRPPLRSLFHSLAHFAHSLARGKVNDWMSQNDLVLSHSAASLVPEFLFSFHRNSLSFS